MEAAELRELRALVERAGGRRAVLLVAEVVADGAPAAATLASFARELLGDEAPPGQGVEPGCRSRSRCRRRALGARLLLVLCRGGAARGRGSRARLREVVRDVRGRLPRGPPPAVVGVLLPGGDGEDAAVLDATLRRHFPAAGTVQAARYSPGSPAALRECRTAACRALRAALQHPAEDGKERERWRLPAFLQCISWSRRSQRKGHVSKAANNVHEDNLQDSQEVALTSLSPNGNYEDAAGAHTAGLCLCLASWSSPQLRQKLQPILQPHSMLGRSSASYNRRTELEGSLKGHLAQRPALNRDAYSSISAQSPVQPDLGCLQGWGTTTSVQPMPVPYCEKPTSNSAAQPFGRRSAFLQAMEHGPASALRRPSTLTSILSILSQRRAEFCTPQ